MRQPHISGLKLVSNLIFMIHLIYFQYWICADSLLSIGRCTIGFELEFVDGTYPRFHRKIPLYEDDNNSNIVHDDNEEYFTTIDGRQQKAAGDEFEVGQVFCSLLLPSTTQGPDDDDEDHLHHLRQHKCADISGEVAHFQVPLIGYECTGRWNQLFYFTSTNRILAVQPEFISKVRGQQLNKRLEVCLEAQLDTNSVVTAPCQQITAADEEESTGLTEEDIVATNHNKQIGGGGNNKHQMFVFLPKNAESKN